MPLMYAPIEQSALFVRLQARPELHAKALDLRARVQTYLRGVDATFAHYTSHAIDHSDQIIRELSGMLFVQASDQESISVELSMTETYFLVISAYLHDVGMVVTEREKFDVLASSSWRTYSADNDAAGDSMQLAQDYSLPESAGSEQELFVSALQQRLQLADYFRSRHADRARGAINDALKIVSDYLDGDASAGRSVTAICSGHGVNRSELGSDVTYPTRRDHFGEPVNVRLLTVLLRVGDLLDMRSERACPLMYSVVSPLPKSSEVHWSQYQRVVSRVTSPSRIEVRAECETAEEHRLLLDWCTWIADEVRDSARLMAGGARHSNWVPPKATIGDSQATIQIERAPGARYRAEDWRFTFDENEIVMRLVRDVHRGRLGFLRELIQNALDTTRARAQLEIASTEPYTNRLPPDLRAKYPLRVRLDVGDRGVEAIAIDDSGLGMTAEIVRDYFLQIGRSWYRSTEFTRTFAFNPTSRFGVGFLSVFAVSEDVRVTTRWHLDQAASALSIRLPGPKSHLLFEDASRDRPGTTVDVRLSHEIPVSEVLNFLSGTCVANEFEVIVTTVESGAEKEIVRLPTPLETTAYVDEYQAGISVKTVASKSEGVFGSVDFLITNHDDGSEDWAKTDTQLEEIATASNPLSEPPALPNGWTALNGLSSAGSSYGQGFAKSIRWRLDLRGPDSAGAAGLDRERVDRRPALREGELEAALDEHIAEVDRSFPYVALLERRFNKFAPEWAHNLPCVQTLDGSLISMREAMEGKIFLALDKYVGARPGLDDRTRLRDRIQAYVNSSGLVGPVVLGHTLSFLTASNTSRLVSRRDSSVHEVGDDQLLIELTGPPGDAFQDNRIAFTSAADRDSRLVRFPTGSIRCLLVKTHPLVAEILSIPDEHKAARNRLIESLRDSTFKTGLAAELRGVGSALSNSLLRAYADQMAPNWYGPEILRLPTRLS